MVLLHSCSFGPRPSLCTTCYVVKGCSFVVHVYSMSEHNVMIQLQKKGVVDFTRRRRWLRRRRQDLTKPSPPAQEAPAQSPRQAAAARRTTSIRQALLVKPACQACLSATGSKYQHCHPYIFAHEDQLHYVCQLQSCQPFELQQHPLPTLHVPTEVHAGCSRAARCCQPSLNTA